MRAYTKAEAAAETERVNIQHSLNVLELARTDNDLWPAISHLRAALASLETFPTPQDQPVNSEDL